ncbi:hypothetical protein BGX38DRAFT_1289702 [Terfezia claveryi]|nr:hypothetical protein BGX38DRAFT_1289702 [Terfezia claveryi]
MASPAAALTSPQLSTISGPSTPRRSPISDGRFDLTPRSKIKALLAGFEDSDDGDNEGSGSPRARVEANIPMAGEDGDGDIRMDGEEEGEEDDEEGVVESVRRRPRAWAGMQEGRIDVDGDSGGEEVTATVRRSRIRKAGSPKSKTNTRKDPFWQNDEEEESDFTVQRSKSPAPDDEDKENDPTLPKDSVTEEDSFDESLPENHLKNPRFAALVAKKHKERKEKEAAEAAKAAARRAFAAELDRDSSDEDSEGARALESSMRPRQKRAAGKKAMEDMARETARLARGMQLVHESKTKRKIGKEELFAKFGFRQQKVPSAAEGGKVAEKQPEVKVEEMSIERKAEIKNDEEVKTSIAQDILNAFGVGDVDDIPPSTTMSTTVPSLDKEFNLPPVKVDFSKYPITIDSGGDDSDIEIVDPSTLSTQAKAKQETQLHSKYAALQARKLAILEAQQKEKRSRELAKKESAISDLRKRSGNTRPLNKSPNQKSKLNPKILSAILLQKSRQQAIKDREEKIAELVAKGVYIPTREEMMKAVDSVQEQMEKARLEAERIKKKEKKEMRLAAILRGETVPDEDSEEEEYVRESGNEYDEEEDGDWAEKEGQEGLYELSGEEEEDILGSGDEEEASGVDDFSDEEKGEDDGDEEGQEEQKENGDEEMNWGDVQVRSSFIADEAGEDGEEEGEEDDDIESKNVVPKTRRPRRKPYIIDDDDSDEETITGPDAMDLDPTSIPSTPAKSKNPFAAFAGFDDVPMGLTQMFQGTIASPDSPKPPSPSASHKQKSKNPFAAFPDIDVGAPLGLTQMFAGTFADDSQDPEPFTLSRKTPTRNGGGVSGLEVLRKMPVNALGNSQAPRGWGGAAAEEKKKEEVVRETQIESDKDMQVDLAYNQSQTPPRPSESGDDGELQKDGGQHSFPGVDLRYTQSQIHTEEDSYNTNITGYLATQSQSQWPNPTPDRGFEYFEDKVKRFDTPKPTQTQATQNQGTLVDSTQQMSPLASLKKKKPRRLLRATEKEAEEAGESSDDEQSNAFALMKKAAKSAKRKQALDAFNKKNSEAKTLVHEQAEESEDEWAGIGGADEPDSDDSNADEKVRRELGDMLDDNTTLDTAKERSKLEAFYAEKEREEDARNVTKLFKDLQNGGLRRKRGAGADFDVSDSDDEEDRRRAVRRRNEARLRKMLLEDRKISKIAENPKRKAFLECLQDNEGDEQGMFLDVMEDEEELSQALDTPIGEKEVVAGGEGRKLIRREGGRLQREDSLGGAGSDNDAFSKGPRLPKSRVGGKKRDVGLAEIRSQLSFLVDDDERLGGGLSDLSDDDNTDGHSDQDHEMGESLIGAPDPEGAADDSTEITTTTTSITAATARNFRRTNRTVIDRISLKRTATLENTAHNTNSKLAFHNPSDADPAAFRVPGLLRRATTNSQLEADAGAGGVGVGGGAGADLVKKRGAKGSSSISYHARERGELREKGRKAGGTAGREEERRRMEMLRRSRKEMGGLGGRRLGLEEGRGG